MVMLCLATQQIYRVSRVRRAKFKLGRYIAWIRYFVLAAQVISQLLL